MEISDSFKSDQSPIFSSGFICAIRSCRRGQQTWCAFCGCAEVVNAIVSTFKTLDDHCQQLAKGAWFCWVFLGFVRLCCEPRPKQAARRLRMKGFARRQWKTLRRRDHRANFNRCVFISPNFIRIVSQKACCKASAEATQELA